MIYSRIVIHKKTKGVTVTKNVLNKRTPLPSKVVSWYDIYETISATNMGIIGNPPIEQVKFERLQLFLHCAKNQQHVSKLTKASEVH